MIKNCKYKFLGLMFLIPSLLLAFWIHTARAETNLQFDPSKNSWVRIDGEAKIKSLALRNASPIPRAFVDFRSKYSPGTIIINTGERRLYRIIDSTSAEVFGIGVGREGFSWKGKERISRKAEWPTWTPPAEMREREALKGVVLPERMEGGANNPLGARALYLGTTLYRIHGTNQPWTIGKAVSSGCIRMANDDVVHLFNQVTVGDLVIVE